MNYGIVIRVLGSLLLVVAAAMLIPLVISIGYGQNDTAAFAICIAITALAGFLLSKVSIKSKTIKIKEGLTIVSLGWVVVSVFGALPFTISGSIGSFVDAFFETVSGFTTTGATIIDDIEALPYGILFWRSFTHWIGGMGILVFTVALLPAMGVGSFQIFKAESPGPITDKIVPRIKDTAKILYITYIGMTVLEIVLLKLGGMTLFESAVHTFGTVGTGGFSTRNASIGAFNSTYIHIVISVFMILAGTNFSLYFALYRGRWREVLKDQELRFYLGIIAASVILISFNTYTSIFRDIGESLKHSFFQVSSIITTTGYATTNYDNWPTFSKGILFVLMFVGGCAGSTGGGMKSIRILVLLKLIKREIMKIFHPRAVVPVKIGQRSLTTDMLNSISSFFILYIVIFVVGTLLISLEGMDLVSSASSVAATLSNIGPGFGVVGPVHTFSQFSEISKLLMCGFMLMGRLELFTVIVLFTTKFWRDEI